MRIVQVSFFRNLLFSLFDVTRLSRGWPVFAIGAGKRSGFSSIAAVVLVAVLGGCSASQLIGLHTADYRDTTAAAGDSQLLLNILRAKDNQPIHFYDLSLIHGSIQLGAGATASIAYQLNGSLTPDTISPALSAQTAPTFDVGTSDTQDFTRGILTQLDPRVVKALFDQGVDPRIMMLLFFQAITSRPAECC